MCGERVFKFPMASLNKVARTKTIFNYPSIVRNLTLSQTKLYAHFFKIVHTSIEYIHNYNEAQNKLNIYLENIGTLNVRCNLYAFINKLQNSIFAPTSIFLFTFS